MSLEKEKAGVAQLRPAPQIIPREEHCISRANISDNALKVLNRLKNAGFQAYLVGGSVRDLLLGREPKDFDVATNARPEQIRELFRQSRIIGRRFRLVHVHFGHGRDREVIEVSTFRSSHLDNTEDTTESSDGRIIRDNVYGSIDEDVWRRDLSVNALFYNIKDFTVVDYVGGMKDIMAGRIRMVGSPLQRYIEDPVRMLRVVRFATKLGFRIDEETEKPIIENAHLLKQIPAARLFEESLKLFLGGCALQTFENLRHYNLFAQLFPQTEAILETQEGGFPHTLLIHALDNTDRRLAEDKPVTPGFIIAAMLWEPLQELAREYTAQGQTEHDAMNLAADVVVSRQIASTAMPRRFTKFARDVWQLQPRLWRRNGKRPHRLLTHPSFRAAYDFLVLRAQAGEDVQELVDWWSDFQQQNGKLLAEGQQRKKRPSGSRRKFQRRPRKPNKQ